MSRVLWIANDTREKPPVLSWWRIRLHRDKDTGCSLLQQLDPRRQSGFAEYYDGRDDWTWPYDIKIHVETESEDIYEGSPYGGRISDIPVRTILTARREYLDVLDIVPPHISSVGDNMRAGWFMLNPEPEVPWDNWK